MIPRLLPWIVGLSLAAVPVSSCASSRGPRPAGATPSPISVQVCSAKDQRQVDEVFALRSRVSTPTWNHHLYSCALDFKGGRILLSVKELSSRAETDAYFASLGRRLGDRQPLYGLGQGAFLTAADSVVVRKDWKVLLVDQSQLDAGTSGAQSFGGTPSEVVASVVMACWAGD